ncbi:MAG TPA: hypothetical protein VG733_14345, partial [Chthoniobacteraceae bacterium]|nr:hypothetical protein [Chthoniobacteraceae bacterium]
EPEDFRSDMYSLGASLFHAIAGRPCFDGETTSLTALRQLKSKPLSLESVVPGVSSATAYVINRSLCMDPKERHQSYEELIEHLNYARTKLLEPATKPGKSDSDLVLYDTFMQQNKGMALKIAAAVALVLVVILGIVVAKFAHHKTSVAGDDKKPVTVSGMGDEQAYLEGRSELVHGDYAHAQTIFRELESRQNIPHPLDRWVMLHEGLGALLSGQLKDSQGIFNKLAEKGVYSDAPEDRVLAGFFVDTARTVALGQPVPGAAAKNFDSGNFAALGLFILGVDDWEMGHLDDADVFFQAFVASDPKPPYEWVVQYKPIAGKYTADLAAFKKVCANVDAADNLKKEKQAMEDLQALKGGLQIPGQIPGKVAVIEAALQKKIDAGDAEEKRRADELARELDQETKNLAAAKIKYNACLPGYQYDDAQGAMQAVQVTDPPLVIERSNLLKKAQWLAQFKQTLIADINAVGYPLPVTKINSAPIEGGVNKATQTQIEIQTQYGMVDVLWTELPPAEIFSMANYFTNKAGSPQAIADRQWLSGVFAMTAGLTKDGRACLDSASQAKPEYHDELALFESGTQ